MPIAPYGVLAARPVDRRREDPQSDDSPHYQIHLVDASGAHYRAAVNVLSQESPSELLFAAVEGFRHPVVDAFPAGPVGWTPLPSQPGGAALDLIRGNLIDPAVMRPLPPDLPGVDNDLADRLDHHVQRAIADPAAVAYLWGQGWGPDAERDKIFGFEPGRGVHDVHMNQGNSGRFAKDDGVWQDGGLVVRLAGQDPVAFFLAFQSQSWHTDDTTGHALEGVPPWSTPEAPASGPARIVAALVNPVGPAPEAESVTLINVSPEPLDLTGWHVADRMKHAQALPSVAVAPGATLVVELDATVQLGNKGGAITLLDPTGLKVHGVSYTGDDADREGWTVTF
jgi:uncharacterized protein YukJ